MSDPRQALPSVTGIADDYDRVADEYTRHIYDELAGKPFDRDLLDLFATLVRHGRVCDVGCGPGHVARYLHERGCDVFGVDISPRMVELAATLNPGIEFRVNDLRALEIDDATLAGIVSFYSLIYLAADWLAPALAGLRRKLRPDGRLLLAVHEGSETRQPGEMWGIPVTLQFNFFTYGQLATALLDAGFTIEQVTHRAPTPTSRSRPAASTPPPLPPSGKERPVDDRPPRSPSALTPRRTRHSPVRESLRSCDPPPGTGRSSRADVLSQRREGGHGEGLRRRGDRRNRRPARPPAC